MKRILRVVRLGCDDEAGCITSSYSPPSHRTEATGRHIPIEASGVLRGSSSPSAISTTPGAVRSARLMSSWSAPTNSTITACRRSKQTLFSNTEER